jgi:pyridoxamine 5'-phosphate oxidase
MKPITDFLPDPLPAEPLGVAAEWLAEATRLAAQPNPNSMVVATTTPDGRPSARVVLCKEIVPKPGVVVFYTNYLSHKGREIAANPRVAVVMHWDHLHRQVRVEGVVEKLPAAESDAYFASRPWQRRVGAWASAQSRPVASRAELVATLEATSARLGVPVPGPELSDPDPGVAIPRPPHWGGYRVWADAVELWTEGESRIHDRARWTRTLGANPAGGCEPGPWTATRLQP